MPEKKKKQAVVIIHGIGEQRPILTLRGFVEPIARYLKEVKKEARKEEAIFWDKPDAISGNYETRKMVMRQGQRHPSTHFYEFYWAHHMRNTNFSHIKSWLQRVVFRRPANVSKRLLPVYYFVWGLILVVITTISLMIFRSGLSKTMLMVTGITSGIAGTTVLGFLSSVIYYYLGDAARYLDPAPGNIDERQAIRKEGMELLKGLHNTKKYDRIVIVAHSLGTAIAYDLVKLLWAEYYFLNDPEQFKAIKDEELADHFQQLEDAVANAKALDTPDGSVQAFQKSQHRSFNYLRATGNPWLITDLVTLGSPLAHAGHLFAQEKGLFDKLKVQREYPICPPYVQSPDPHWILESKDVIHPGLGKLKYFNHSSPFAVTRWTNFYYSTDYVGGPVAPLFGQGIKDIAINKRGKFFAYPTGHTTYWDFENKDHVLKEIWDILEG